MNDQGTPEDLYKVLFDHNPQPMWVYDAETLAFLTVNAAAVNVYGYSREEFLTMRITDIRPPEDVPRLLASVSAVSVPHRQSGVWRHARKDGRVIHVEIAWHEIPFNGRRGRLVIAHDVTERERAIDEIRSSRELYERQYEALAELTRRSILQPPDLNASLREITRNTAQSLDIERVSVWRMTPERDAIISSDLFELSSGKHSSGIRLAESSYPAYFRALADNDVLSADDAVRDPRTSEFANGYLGPAGITAMLDAPIIVDGELAGVLCFEHVGPPRVWTAGERSFAVSAANLAALMMAQQSLTESRAWLRTILDSEPECVSLVSPEGRLLEMNPAGLRMIEAEDRSAAIGQNVLDIVHPEHAEDYLGLLDTVMGGQSEHLQFRIVCLRGTERWIETHAAPLRTSDGTVAGMLAVTRDITQKLRSEADLHESRRRLSTLMDHLPGMAYRCRNEPTWPMEFVSNGGTALTGFTVEDLVEGGAHPYGDLPHPDDQATLWSQVQAAVQAHMPFEFEYRIACADGSEKWVWERGQAVYDAAGQPVALEGFVADTTQRKRSADALRIGEERFRLLASATSDAIWDWDIAADRLWWSEGSAELFGLTRDEMGTALEAWSERVHPDDRSRVAHAVERALAPSGGVLRVEYRFRRGDESYATVLDRARVIRDADGVAVRMIGGMSDLTDVKRLEGQLLHSQKMESVGRLAGGVAHDFNNLLTVILGTVDLTLGNMDQTDPLASDLGEIREAAQRAGGLTQQLLAFSRRQVLQPRVLDINAVIAGTIALLRRVIGEDIEVRFTPGAQLWCVRADPGQLEQVLLNLAVNARDAMPDGGLLTLATHNVMIDEVFAAGIPAARIGAHVAITVTDTGVGMDAATREHAFEPFFTTKGVGKGTGLGLATVYGIVQQSGGSIDLYSEEGHGASFRIFLPRADADAGPAETAQSAHPQGGSETILLVEDESAVRRLTERVLTAAGYTVLACDGGQQALDTLARKGDDRVDLLLTDVVMPQMNGPELARRIVAASPGTRVLFMSGYTDDAMVKHGVNAGQTRFLEKPFTIAELTAAVRDALSSPRRATDQGARDSER